MLLYFWAEQSVSVRVVVGDREVIAGGDPAVVVHPCGEDFKCSGTDVADMVYLGDGVEAIVVIGAMPSVGTIAMVDKACGCTCVETNHIIEVVEGGLGVVEEREEANGLGGAFDEAMGGESAEGLWCERLWRTGRDAQHEADGSVHGDPLATGAWVGSADLVLISGGTNRPPRTSRGMATASIVFAGRVDPKI